MEKLSAALESFFCQQVACSERVDALLRLLVAALLRHDALRRLLAVQQLDALDVEGAYQASLTRTPTVARRTHFHPRVRTRTSRRTTRC